VPREEEVASRAGLDTSADSYSRPQRTTLVKPVDGRDHIAAMNAERVALIDAHSGSARRRMRRRLRWRIASSRASL
jgi:hypothetical protein